MVATMVAKNNADPITMGAPPVIRASGGLHAGCHREPENHGQDEHRDDRGTADNADREAVEAGGYGHGGGSGRM